MSGDVCLKSDEMMFFSHLFDPAQPFACHDVVNGYGSRPFDPLRFEKHKKNWRSHFFCVFWSEPICDSDAFLLVQNQ